ncbi:MAG: M50 family metallopeptidase [Nitrososphaerota archaeon]|nr:M50 family metallopeptidase [Nitrososphaerota archaeon]
MKSDTMARRSTLEETTVSSVTAGSVHAFSLSNSRGTLFFGITASVMMLAAQLLHAYVHEMLGHGVVALLVGQQLKGFYLSPFGASYTFVSISPTPAFAALQYSAGTIVSVALGVVLLFRLYPWIKRRRSSFALRLAILLFIIMLESDLLYGFSSPLIQFGDINDIARILSIHPSSLLSLVFFPLVLIVYYPILREYLELLAPFAGKDQVLKDRHARFRFLLKVTYVPTIFILLEELVGIGIFSVSAGVFFVVGLVVLVSPLLPAVYMCSYCYDPSKRASNVLQDATDAEARLAFNDLLKYTIICLLFMAATEVAFGPTPRIVSLESV